MSGRKNIVILTGIVLAVSLLVGSVTTMILSNHYNHAHMQVLGGICRKIIQKQPEAEQAVLEALKEYQHGPASLPGENIILAYGYSPSDFWKSAEKNSIFTSASVLLAGALLFLIACLLWRQKDNMRIKMLTEYLEKVNTGGSGVLFQAGEDEFSKLQDEIYKTVTELHQTRDAALKARNNFAENLYNIAHQIKTPITSISLSLQMMHEKPSPGHLEQIHRQLSRMAHFEEALLLLSRIDTGTLSLKQEKVDVFTVLMLAADNLQEMFLKADVSVHIPESGEILIQADMEWTMEAVINVMKNCMEHTPPGGSVHCSYEQNHSSVVYQKADSVCILPQQAQSQELLALGGLEKFSGGSFQIEAPIIILDDESFGDFCGQIGIASRLDGTIILNRFWDSVNSNFRYPEYIPYVREDMDTVVLNNAAEKGDMAPETTVKVPELACTKEYPLLREDYGKAGYPLVQFMSVSLWKEIKGQMGGAGQDTYVRVLANDRTEPDTLNVLEDEIAQMVSPKYEMESENRIQEREDNDKMIEGYELILGGFCVLLAMIGVAHVFSHTLGFLRQRKREFARYMSVGLTPEGIRKMFCIEALVIVGRPVLVTLGVTIVAVAFMIKASHLDPVEFILLAPIVPILLFVSAVFAFVALAYYLGGKRILKVSLVDALRDDTMM